MTISGKIYSDNAAAFNTQGFSISDDWGTIGVGDMEQGDAFATATDITDDEAYDGGAATGINTYAPADEQVDPQPCPTCRPTLAASSSRSA